MRKVPASRAPSMASSALVGSAFIVGRGDQGEKEVRFVEDRWELDVARWSAAPLSWGEEIKGRRR